MALIVTTPTPIELLDAIKRAITEGRITTWECDDDGDFTHSASQWKHRAWLSPRIEEGDQQLIFTTVSPIETTISVTVYAVYHGRFAEMLLAHFDAMFTDIECSALGDVELGDDLGDDEDRTDAEAE